MEFPQLANWISVWVRPSPMRITLIELMVLAAFFRELFKRMRLLGEEILRFWKWFQRFRRELQNSWRQGWRVSWIEGRYPRLRKAKPLSRAGRSSTLLTNEQQLK